MKGKPLRMAYRRFTSCCGCQLTFLNCESDLAEIARAVEMVDFSMISSRRDDQGSLDVVFIEGSVSRPEELGALLELRSRSGVLVAVGACALTGGVNALGGLDRAALCAKVYGTASKEKAVFPPQPISRFVKVDLEVAGCPPERSEHLRVLGSLLLHGLPALPDYAVCMECRQRENPCLLIEGRQPCLGPVTRAGCDALCPSFGVVCEGCRGATAEANRGEEFRLLLELGLSEREVQARMERFSGDPHENHQP